MAITPELKRIADLALVACDASYAGDNYVAANGSSLKEYRDQDTINGGLSLRKPSTVSVPTGFVYLDSLKNRTPSKNRSI